MESKSVGLREKKYFETRSRLEDAAITLALSSGLDKTTIEAISEMANVSPRTFFNYFDSKEDAVLGIHRATLEENDDAPPDKSNETGVIETVTDLLLDVFAPSLNNPSFRKSRMQLIRKNPHLLERQFAHMTKVNQDIATKVDKIIQDKHPHHQLDKNIRSEVIVMTCVGGVKVAVKDWLTTNTELSVESIRQQAITIIRQTVKEL